MRTDAPLFLLICKALHTFSILYKYDLILSLLLIGFLLALNNDRVDLALTAFLDSFPWAEVCVLRKQITWKTLCLVFLLSRHLVSFGRSQDLCICRILCWGHWMQTGPYNSSGLTLYQSPSDISPNLGWTECSYWVRAAGCAWEPDQSPTGVNDWGMVNLEAWSSILLFYNTNSMFLQLGNLLSFSSVFLKMWTWRCAFPQEGLRHSGPLCAHWPKAVWGLARAGR